MLELPELLREIFLFACVPTGPNHSTTWSIQYITEPVEHCPVRTTRLSIAATCQLWRDIALETRPLWSHIVTIVYGKDAVDDDGRYPYMSPSLPLILLELERAATTPLDLTVELRDVFRWPSSSEIPFILREAILRSSTIAILDAASGAGVTSLFRHEDDILSFPSLTSCFVYIPRVTHALPINFSGAPRLRQLSLLGPAFLSTQNLTRLSLSLGPKMEGVDYIRSHGSKLQLLGLSRQDNGPGPELHEPIHLPSLTHLSYNTHLMVSPSFDLLASIDAPKLEHLRLNARNVLIFPLSSNHFPSLRTLEISRRVSVLHLYTVLKAFPHILELIISQEQKGWGDIAQLFTDVNQGPGDFALVPRLKMMSAIFNDLGWAQHVMEARNSNKNGTESADPFVLQVGRGEGSSVNSEWEAELGRILGRWPLCKEWFLYDPFDARHWDPMS